MRAGFDLDAYLARIGLRGRGSSDPPPGVDAVAALLLAHMAAIPFENLDVLLGRGVRVDPDSVFAKLVTARRGGYCFEHGTLFQAALRALGIEAVAHAARVLLVVPKAEAPRTHMFLTVRASGRTWVLDPGFGGQGPLVPRAAGRRATRCATAATCTVSCGGTASGCSKVWSTAR